MPSRSQRDLCVLLLVFASTLTLRVWGIHTRFWLLRDQIRDWSIALGPFGDLPWVGPATHVNGYTIGPAFYWILWAIRVTVGPWFDNLPHAGGIGQAILHSGADTLLCLAIWQRTRSMWVALTAIVLISSAAYDLCFAALVWNPTMGTTLAKIATALVLLDWHRTTTARAVITAAVAWAAVHAYTGAVFVTVAVFAVFVLDPFIRRDGRAAVRNATVIIAVVALLQVPYLAHQIRTGFGEPAMSAVTGSVWQILTGAGDTQFAISARTYVGAVSFIQAGPWNAPWMAALLLLSAAVVAARFRQDVPILVMTLIPGALAIVGYGLFLGALDFYYYLSLMPAAVLTVVFATLTLPRGGVAQLVGIIGLAGALALVPSRVRLSTTMHRLPEYGAMVDGSRVIAQRGIAMRAVRTNFALPPTCDPEFIYRILGGRIDRTAPWLAIIAADGSVKYEQLGAL